MSLPEPTSLSQASVANVAQTSTRSLVKEPVQTKNEFRTQKSQRIARIGLRTFTRATFTIVTVWGTDRNGGIM